MEGEGGGHRGRLTMVVITIYFGYCYSRFAIWPIAWAVWGGDQETPRLSFVTAAVWARPGFAQPGWSWPGV